VRRRWTWIAWSLLAVFVVSMVVTTILSVANGNFQQEPAGFLAQLAGYSAFMVVGALIVAHRPDNAIGWIFTAIGLLAATWAPAGEYITYLYWTRSGSLPDAILVAWALLGGTWYLTVALALVFAPLLFPTGRLVSPRWRPVAWLAGAATAAFMVLAALKPDLDRAPGRVIANPIGVAWVVDPEHSLAGVALLSLMVVLLLLAFGSLVVRFRRSRGDERQQLKWITYASGLLPLAGLAYLLPEVLGTVVFTVPMVFLPAAVGIAILRYRLYDIDRLINRTLVYGLLTALLAGVYTGAVLVLGQLFGGVGRDPPSWAVAGATLAVAALFQPARRRIQAVVDRRFNRRKYNAAKTVEAFSLRLRDEVDLDALSAELLAVADQTMQPTTASLWLRQPARPHGRIT
jgi:MFS family permease